MRADVFCSGSIWILGNDRIGVETAQLRSCACFVVCVEGISFLSQTFAARKDLFFALGGQP